MCKHKVYYRRSHCATKRTFAILPLIGEQEKANLDVRVGEFSVYLYIPYCMRVLILHLS